MATAKKAPAKKSAAKKSAAKKASSTTSEKKASAKKTAAKKAPAKKSAKKSADSGHCWPGFEPVPGKEPGTKGSCKPKKTQTAGEKKADSKAAAATKARK